MAADFQLFTTLRFDPALLSIPSTNFTHAGWNSRHSSPLYMLDFHRDRILRAATHWRWNKAVEVLSGDAGLKTLADFITKSIAIEQRGTPHRVKVLVSEDGRLDAVVAPVPDIPLVNLFPEKIPEPGTIGQDDYDGTGKLPLPNRTYTILVDDYETAKSEFTHFKTTARDMYDAARQRTAISLADEKEVLLINSSDGAVMEGSLTTPYFWRDGRWVTPPVTPKYSLDDSGGQDGTTRRWALERGIAVEQNIQAESLVDGEECWISNGLRGFIFGSIKRLQK